MISLYVWWWWCCLIVDDHLCVNAGNWEPIAGWLKVAVRIRWIPFFWLFVFICIIWFPFVIIKGHIAKNTQNYWMKCRPSHVDCDWRCNDVCDASKMQWAATFAWGAFWTITWWGHTYTTISTCCNNKHTVVLCWCWYIHMDFPSFFFLSDSFSSHRCLSITLRCIANAWTNVYIVSTRQQRKQNKKKIVIFWDLLCSANQ